MIKPFERLEPTHGNGLAFQDILVDDYLRVGISDADSYRMVHGEAGDALSNLVERMYGGNKEYYGVREGSLLTGVASLGNWYYGDEQPFVGRIKTSIARARHRIHHANGTSTTDESGIFAFGVADEASSYTDIASSLLTGLRGVTSEKGHSMLKVAIDQNDEQFIETFKMAGGVELSRKIGKMSINSVERSYRLFGIETN